MGKSKIIKNICISLDVSFVELLLVIALILGGGMGS